MSADNYIFIDTKKKEVWDCVASCICPHKKHCGKCQKLRLIKKCKNLTDLLNEAEKANNYYVEYGIHTKLWCK